MSNDWNEQRLSWYAPDKAMTDKDLFKLVKSLGLTISKLDGEYRLTYPSRCYPGNRENQLKRQEEQAYYGTDRQDVLNTAYVMNANREKWIS